MRNAKTNSVGCSVGPEVYNEVQRLLFEWHDADAADRAASVPRLVEQIVQLVRAEKRGMARLSPHDNAEAA